MTAHVLISCDAVHPERTPPKCRAFLATDTAIAVLAYGEAAAAGWTQTDDGDDRCPSCSRAAHLTSGLIARALTPTDQPARTA